MFWTTHVKINMEFFKNITDILAKRNIIFYGTHNKQSVESLLDEEKKVISGAVLKRQEEFATGRWCARKIFKKMGLNSVPLLNGNRGEPIWPDGICGSISHTKGAYSAAAAFVDYYLSIGIDIENIKRKISEGAAKIILNKDETEWLPAAGTKREEYIKLIFSAKESVFKLFYPVIKRCFSFTAVSILPLSSEGIFSFILNEDFNNIFPKGKVFTGHYFYNKSWLLALSCLDSSRKD